MIEVFRALLELQEVDLQIADLQQERGTIPGERIKGQEVLQIGNARVSEAELAVTERSKEQRRLESEFAVLEASVERFQSKTSDVTSNEAYRALLREIEMAQEKASSHETAILEAMEGVEEAVRALDLAKQEAQTAAEQVAAEGVALDDREKSIEADLGTAGEQRTALAGTIEPKALKDYDYVAAKKLPAIVFESDQVCEGCRMTVATPEVIDLRKAKKLTTCIQCKRILIAKSILETK